MVDAIPDDLMPELSWHERRLALRLAKALNSKQFEVQIKLWRACIDVAAELANIDQLARLVSDAEARRSSPSPVLDFEAVGYSDR